MAKLSLLLGFITLLISLLIVLCYPSTEKIHENIRREWEAEERGHQVLRDAWISERKAMVVDRETWQKERADHSLERETAAAERERWRKDRDLESKAAAAEREQWRKERIDHENRERQEEEQKRALIVWENLQPSKCVRYGTREYSATLGNVPLGLDPLKECWNKGIDIHGRQILPSRCDTQVCSSQSVSFGLIFRVSLFQGACGTVTGHWTVDFKEATCVTWWNGYHDKVFSDMFQIFFMLTTIQQGCAGGIHVRLRVIDYLLIEIHILFFSKQRYESGLENLQAGDDWQEMCATTPGHVQGRDFDGPTSCATWVS